MEPIDDADGILCLNKISQSLGFFHFYPLSIKGLSRLKIGGKRYSFGQESGLKGSVVDFLHTNKEGISKVNLGYPLYQQNFYDYRFFE